MRCPFCSSQETQVKDSRPSEENRVIRRRRSCHDCGRRFTTFERFEVQQTIVIKKDATRELFTREKLMKSLMIALRKRPVSPKQMSSIVADIEQALLEDGRNEVQSTEIGQLLLKHLKEVDFIGYVRYASVYNEFSDPKEFIQLLKDVVG